MINMIIKELLKNEVKLEKRIEKIIKYFQDNFSKIKIFVSFIDATGKHGNQLTQLLNTTQNLEITSAEMSKLLNEDGQILEGKIEIHSDQKHLITISISDGMNIDLIEFDFQIPDTIIHPYKIINDA